MMTERYETTRARLEARGQLHVLDGWDALDDAARNRLLDQVDSLPWDVIETVHATLKEDDPPGESFQRLEPPHVQDPGPAECKALHAVGEEWIAAGRIAAFTVAGGQGTRLGWNGPKGTYPATPISGKPLFACFAEQLQATGRRYGVDVPWYILTSPENDATTRNFFLDNKCFGLERNNIMLCMQGTMPVLDADTGLLMLSAPGCIATSPDGHGGSLDALMRSGALADMEVRGIDLISYAQVDNPLATMIDPRFIGVHASTASSSGQVSSKMVEKIDPAERVGVFARLDDRARVVEYSDLPPGCASEVSEDGRLRFNAGNIAIHLLGRSFVQGIVGDGGAGLPWHRAVKIMPYWDARAGCMVSPTEPNAIKLERFIFDVLALADRSAVLKVERAAEFAPIKNADGVDSPATSQRLQVDLHGGWLEQCGVQVPRDEQGHVNAAVEISPLTAMRPEDLQSIQLPGSIEPGASILL